MLAKLASPSALCLWSETDTWAALGLVENDVLALQEDITVDGETNTSIALDTTVASGRTVTDWCVVDVLARHDSLVAINHEAEAWKSCAARENVTTVGRAVLGTRDLAVVGSDNRVGGEQERSSGVSNTTEGAGPCGDGCARADSIARGSEHPEALAGVDRGVGDGARVLCAVEFTKVVATCGMVLQGRSEELGWKPLGNGRVKERVLLGRPDGVDGAES
jgi:hypothetical protein